MDGAKLIGLILPVRQLLFSITPVLVDNAAVWKTLAGLELSTLNTSTAATKDEFYLSL